MYTRNLPGIFGGRRPNFHQILTKFGRNFEFWSKFGRNFQFWSKFRHFAKSAFCHFLLKRGCVRLYILCKNNVFLREFSYARVCTSCFSGGKHPLFTKWERHISWKFTILVEIWHFAKSRNLIIFLWKSGDTIFCKSYKRNVFLREFLCALNVFRMWHASFSAK